MNTSPSDAVRPPAASIKVGLRPSALSLPAEELAGSQDPLPTDWRRLGSALRRWRVLVIGLTLLGLVGGLLATHWVRPKYVAQATIWIDARDQQDQGPAPFQAGRILDPEAWLDLVRSYAVLDPVAHDQRLFLRLPSGTPATQVSALAVADTFQAGHYRLFREATGAGYRLESADGTVLDRAATGRPIGVAQGLRWTPPAGALPPGGSLAFEMVTLRDAANELSDALNPHIDPQGNLLRLQLEGSDPVRLAAVLEGVTEQYVRVAGDLKRQKLTELTARLADQLDRSTTDLTNAEVAYQSFRASTITLPSDRAAPAGGVGADDPAVARYFALEASGNALRDDREAIERALANGGLAVEALNAVPAVRASRELGPALDQLATAEGDLRTLRARYAPEHPQVIALAGRVAMLRDTTIPVLAGELANELRVQEVRAGQQAKGVAGALRQIPVRAREDAGLRREMTLAEELHNTLQRRHDQAQLAVASSIPDARILDPAAVPTYPVRDTSGRILILAVLASLAFAIGLAVLLDRLDPRVRYASQVSRELGLPILGALPHVPSGVRPPGKPVDPAWSAMVEAVRGVRMAVFNETADRLPMLLTISSPGSGDGKSFLARQLAMAFAEAGYSTVLVDGDVRRGRLHQHFARSRRPGLCDVLEGTVPLEAALRPTEFPYLSLLSCGSRLNHAPELLAGARMTAVFAALQARHQVVICDSPPLHAGIDPFVLAVGTGHLLLVLRAGVSHRELTAAKLTVLSRMPIILLGAVMNDVPADQDYGQYSYYLSGYETHDEGRTEMALSAGS